MQETKSVEENESMEKKKLVEEKHVQEKRSERGIVDVDGDLWYDVVAPSRRLGKQ